MKSIYIGNLPFDAQKDEVIELFSICGEVHSINFIYDHSSGEFRGIGFIEMDDYNAEIALRRLRGARLGGRKLFINTASRKPSSQRSLEGCLNYNSEEQRSVFYSSRDTQHNKNDIEYKRKALLKMLNENKAISN